MADHITGRGGAVVEVPTRRTVRSRRRYGASKSDVIDAEACARACLEAPLGVVVHVDEFEAIRVLVRWRESLVHTQTRAICRIKARISQIEPQAARGLRLTTSVGWSRLARYEPAGHGRHRDAIRDLVRYEATQAGERLTQIRSLERRLADEMPDPGQALIDTIQGIGPIGAATILAEVGDVTRFRSEAAFAMWAAAAPLDASSGQQHRHRHNRGGNRQIDRVLDTVIRVQLIHNGQAARYVERRRTNGDNTREAFRALKRQLSRKVYRILKRHPATQTT
ncbi:MAG: transposase [Actinomycetota bacterium]|nr:transposase [Actinomycetota bacterium]